MKALLITGYGKIEDNIEFSEVEKPNIDDDQVLIEIHSAAVNPIDYKIIQGLMRPIKKLNFPARIGFDVAGKVIDKGLRVKNINIGDEVFSRVSTDSPGTFAEYIAADSKLVCLKPDNLSYNESASLPLVGLTSIQSLEAAGLKKGDKVLIHAGSGGIGSFAIQYAKSKGAYVYTTTSTKNVSWVKDLGADRVIDYKKEDYLKVIDEIDIVFDTLGGQYTYDAFKVIKEGGKVVSIAGNIDKETAKDMGMNAFFRFILAVMRIRINLQIKRKSAFYKYVAMKPNQEQLLEIKELVEQGSIKPVIDKVYPFSESVDALLHQKSGRAKGKIIIEVRR